MFTKFLDMRNKEYVFILCMYVYSYSLMQNFYFMKISYNFLYDFLLSFNFQNTVI